MKILWLNWKDGANPKAGGAEVVNEELAKRLVALGHEVKFLVAGFPGGEPAIKKDGYDVLRVGSRWTVYWHAYRYYKKHLQNWPDVVVDEINTIPFFASLYAKNESIKSESHESKVTSQKSDFRLSTQNSQLSTFLFVHQLAREIWFYEMFFPLSLIGYLLEPLYLRLLNKSEVITVSESTRQDLLQYGFKPECVHIISEGITLKPVDDPARIEKFKYPTMLALGAIRAMKRTDQVIKAFQIAKKEIPSLQLVVAGSPEGKYAERVLESIKSESHKVESHESHESKVTSQKSDFRLSTLQTFDSVHYLGKISDEKKLELMQKVHVLCVASVKEGWGLVVTEANSQGTPAVVYNVDGLRDSVQDGRTGRVCKTNTPEGMAQEVVELLGNPAQYQKLQKNAWEWSKTITFKKSTEDFLNVIESKVKKP